MPCLVLDAEALSALSEAVGSRAERVRQALRAAVRLEREVICPAVVLAELYRGQGRNQLVDACLSRETGIQIRSTDRALAKLVGSVLAAAGLGSAHLADAHVIAAVIEQGGGVALTGDPQDLERLAAAYRNVTVVSV